MIQATADADRRRAVDPLASPSVGTASDDLITPCAGPSIRPVAPPPPEVAPALAVSLSGGGFRATLAGLGVLRLLADIGRLGSVRYLSSVSGGSIANALFAVRYEQVRQRGFTREAFDELVLQPFLDAVTTRSFAVSIVWRIVTRLAIAHRTRALADVLDEWFFDGLKLEALDPSCRWIFNAANASTGVRFGFERNRLGDYVSGYVSSAGTGLRLADAVAASSAFPGPLSALTLDGIDFPCQPQHRPRLLDGGAYDNLGLEAIDDLSKLRDGQPADDAPCLVVLNAGGQFRVGRYVKVPIVGDVLRTMSLLYRQTTALRTETMVERFKLWEAPREPGMSPPKLARRGVLFGLASKAEDLSAEWLAVNPRRPDDERVRLALIKTSLSRMDRERECVPLVNRGWWLAGATLATYHKDILSPPYPVPAPL